MTTKNEMRSRIKEVATEMLIRHGYLGLRFQQIADALEITRGNVHYHFGNKRSIADEVIADYIAETLSVFQKIWLDPDISLGEKINGTMLSNRRRYLRFNPTGKTVHAWSLIARMRLERDILSAPAKKTLNNFVAQLDELMTGGVRLAIRTGNCARMRRLSRSRSRSSRSATAPIRSRATPGPSTAWFSSTAAFTASSTMPTAFRKPRAPRPRP